MFRTNTENQHQFLITKKGDDFYLKRLKDFKPTEESIVFTGSYREARKLWHQLVKPL